MAAPKTDDGKPIFLANLFRGDVAIVHCGVGDDIANGIRFDGQVFQSSTTLQEDKIIEWQFKEWIYLAGGILNHKNAILGDWVSFEVCAPLTSGISNPGAGFYAKQPIGGGANRFIPQTNGGWDLNLVETLNANVQFTKVVPVPNTTKTGYFDWDEDTEIVTSNSNGEGQFDLIDVSITLSKFVAKVPLVNSVNSSIAIDFTVPAVKPKKILAHWKYKVILHSASVHSQAVEIGWWLFTARRKTT